MIVGGVSRRSGQMIGRWLPLADWRGGGGVKGYSRYIKGHAAQGKCSGVFSTLPSSRFISNFHKLRCGADGFFNSNLQIYFKSFLIFVKNLPFN